MVNGKRRGLVQLISYEITHIKNCLQEKMPVADWLIMYVINTTKQLYITQILIKNAKIQPHFSESI